MDKKIEFEEVKFKEELYKNIEENDFSNVERDGIGSDKMQITRIMIPQYKWNLKCPYAMNAEYITIHNTDNDASAMAEVSYMLGNNNPTSFHVAVDDYRIVQGIEFNRNTWNASDGLGGTGNRKSISIEICYSKSGGERFIKAERNAAQYIAHLLKERNWGIDRIRTHKDWSGKYCPHRTLNMGWTRFLNMIQSELNILNRQSLKLEDIYNEDLYASKYADLRGHNLWSHLNIYGIKEGRIFSYIFDAKYYRDKYEDLKRAYGNDYQGLFNHFITYGFLEGRQASIIYGEEFYKNNNSDLSNRNYIDLLNHFYAYGMNEGRQASSEFNPKIYRNKNKDLDRAFGNNYKLYFKHYLTFGINERRVSK